jgi:uncharacterized protein YggL (DUF469 family)
MNSLVATVAILGMGSTSLMAGGELIQNGSFENFSINKDHGKWKLVNFDNWSGSGEVWNHDLGRVATDGTYKAELDVGRRNVDSLTQSIATEDGETYTFSLDAYARRAGTSDFELLVDGEVLLRVTPESNWGKYGVEFKGNGTEQTISIREIAEQDNGSGTVIDNISVQSDKTLDELKAEARALVEIMEPQGIDQVQDIIDTDRNVQSRVSAEDIAKAKDAATQMNNFIKEAIQVNGLANDGVVSIADTLEINKYLLENHADKWAELRADYELVASRDARAEVTILNNNALRTVWASIYNLGFEGQRDNRYTSNMNGDRSTSFTTVGYYLGSVIQPDVDTGELNNSEFKEVEGTTDTNLDMIVNVILTDEGLLRSVPTSDLRVGAEMADKMNHLIVEAIKAEGLGNDKNLTTADIRTINNYLVANHAEEWATLHGDDEDDAETGYHRIQNDGATTRMYADNVMNSIADGIYHLGFATNNHDRLLNEDGNNNQRFEKVAWWLDSSLKEDLEAGKFTNSEYKEVEGTTGTSFDKIIPYIYADEGLIYNVSMEDIREGARTANEMNKLLVEAIKTTAVAEDDYISIDEVKTLNEYLVSNYAAEWAELHGDDEDNEETGYHRIQNDGASSIMHNSNTINNLADGIYHLGFPTEYANNLENEDGNKNVSFASISYWLNKSLEEDYAQGRFK